jgi:hypothetical protein
MKTTFPSLHIFFQSSAAKLFLAFPGILFSGLTSVMAQQPPAEITFVIGDRSSHVVADSLVKTVENYLHREPPQAVQKYTVIINYATAGEEAVAFPVEQSSTVPPRVRDCFLKVKAGDRIIIGAVTVLDKDGKKMERPGTQTILIK